MLRLVGKLPDGLFALHRCNNRICCNFNPGHVYAGTSTDNNRDSVAAGRRAPVPGDIFRALNAEDGEGDDWFGATWLSSVLDADWCASCGGMGFGTHAMGYVRRGFASDRVGSSFPARCSECFGTCVAGIALSDVSRARRALRQEVRS